MTSKSGALRLAVHCWTPNPLICSYAVSRNANWAGQVRWALGRQYLTTTVQNYSSALAFARWTCSVRIRQNIVWAGDGDQQWTTMVSLPQTHSPQYLVFRYTQTSRKNYALNWLNRNSRALEEWKKSRGGVANSTGRSHIFTRWERNRLHENGWTYWVN